MIRIALLVVMATTLAQVFPSCGGEGSSDVIGWVEAKRVDSAARSFILTINFVDYEVPGYFWSQVGVGDLVKWDGLVWTIVKKAEMLLRYHV